MIRRPPRSKRTTHSFPTRRSSDLGFPDVPTMDEHGFKGFDASSWYGVVGPADMPKELALAINADINKVLLMPDVAQRFDSYGVEDGGGSVDDFASFMAIEYEKWGKDRKSTRLNSSH